MSSAELSKFSVVETFETAVGEDRILIAANAQERYGANLNGLSRHLAGAVVTRTVAEVQQVCRIAVQHAVPIYPISGGRNWGYGSATPVCDDAIILDLSQHQEITIDESTDTACLEPGVTQARFRDFLVQNQLPYVVPTTGAGPSGSIVGNALERGYGLAPITDHFSAIRGITAVLADGSLYQSPLEKLGGAPHRWGLGPSFDGVFSQSSLGIVVNARIALSRQPATITAIRIQADQVDNLVSVCKQLSSRLPGTLAAMQILNSLRMAALRVPYPSASSVLSPHEVSTLERNERIAPWTAVGILAGEPSVVSAAKRVAKRIAKRAGLRFTSVSERQLDGLARARPLLSLRMKNQLTLTECLFKHVRGIPNALSHRLLAWRPGGETIERDREPTSSSNGLYWYAPLVKFDPDQVTQFTNFITQNCRDFGINPLITMNKLSTQAFGSTILILFDRQSSREVARAAEFYSQLVDRGLAQGFVPYRLPASQMDSIPELDSSRLMQAMKASLDPGGLLSPGRYENGRGFCKREASNVPE